MRVVVLTGDQDRHRWVAREIAKEYTVALIVHEKKPTTYEDIAKTYPEVAKHFAINQFYEQKFLFEEEQCSETYPHVPVIELPRKAINEKNLVRFVKTQDPDVIFLFGASILSSYWFDVFGSKIINMHLGLSPYFRGSGTNFWPLYLGQPEYVGATIHVAVEEVDAGGIICQVRPEIEVTDTLYDINIKTLKTGVAALLQSGRDFLAGIEPIDQEGLSYDRYKVWRKRDLTADAVKTVWENFCSGMVGEYLKHREVRNHDAPIIDKRKT